MESSCQPSRTAKQKLTTPYQAKSVYTCPNTIMHHAPLNPQPGTHGFVHALKFTKYYCSVGFSTGFAFAFCFASASNRSRARYTFDCR